MCYLSILCWPYSPAQEENLRKNCLMSRERTAKKIITASVKLVTRVEQGCTFVIFHAAVVAPKETGHARSDNKSKELI